MVEQEDTEGSNPSCCNSSERSTRSESICARGEIGKHIGFKFQRSMGLGVQVPSDAFERAYSKKLFFICICSKNNEVQKNGFTE